MSLCLLPTQTGTVCGSGGAVGGVGSGTVLDPRKPTRDHLEIRGAGRAGAGGAGSGSRGVITTVGKDAGTKVECTCGTAGGGVPSNTSITEGEGADDAEGDSETLGGAVVPFFPFFFPIIPPATPIPMAIPSMPIPIPIPSRFLPDFFPPPVGTKLGELLPEGLRLADGANDGSPKVGGAVTGGGVGTVMGAGVTGWASIGDGVFGAAVVGVAVTEVGAIVVGGNVSPTMDGPSERTSVDG